MAKSRIDTSTTSGNHAARSEIAVEQIELNRLVPWKDNVRKTGADSQVDELAASIGAHGLLQPLVVKMTAKGKHEIVAGRRRYLALLALVAQKRMEPDQLIPCRVIPNDANSTEVSLAENVVRVAMHPADQFEAFSKLAEQGSTPTAIAARFGVTESTVKRRLALGRVSPLLMTAYRNDEMDLEQLSAFTVTDDRVEQERVWAALKETYNDNAHAIRRMLTESDIPSTDKRVRFVGLPAYEAVGGSVRRDLFSEGEHGAYVMDVPLLNELVRKKLEGEAKPVRKEGWKWVEYRPDFGYEERSRFEQLDPMPIALSKEQQHDLDRLRTESERLSDSDEDDAWERQREVDKKIDELENNGQFTTDQMSLSGVVLTLTHSGELSLERGLVRPEDVVAIQSSGPGSAESGIGKARTGLAASLVESLTAHKTAIIAAELTENADVALVAVVHALMLSTLSGSFYRRDAAVQVSATRPNLKMAAGSTAITALEKARTKSLKKIPKSASALWAWCLKQKQGTLLDLLALCVAQSVNAVQFKHDPVDADRLVHANALAEALDIDMTKWFRPTAENFFARVGKPIILAAFAEATGNPPPTGWASMKKAELAAAAEREIGQNTEWLPEQVRIGTSTLEEREVEDDLDDEDAE